MPSPYPIGIISNNSMARRVRYEQTIIVFSKHEILYRDSSMKQRLFPTLSYV